MFLYNRSRVPHTQQRQKCQNQRLKTINSNEVTHSECVPPKQPNKLVATEMFTEAFSLKKANSLAGEGVSDHDNAPFALPPSKKRKLVTKQPPVIV
jgi:hypothetical protein